MNLIHRYFCRSSHWRRHLHRLLRWATEDVALTDADVLELGSGPGLSTDWLRPRVGSLTAVEYDARDARALARRLPDVRVVHGDASELPFPEASFDVVVCFTMLHHVSSRSRQDQLLSEAHRVLRPGGLFAGSDSRSGPLFALAHLGDAMLVVSPSELPQRLAAVGFLDTQVATRGDAFRFRASTPM